MEWFAFIIPVAAALYLRRAYKRDVTALEIGIMLVIVAITIAGFKAAVGRSLTDDVEYWGSYIVGARYSEPWSEEVACIHIKYCTGTRSTTDSNGKATTESYEYACGTEHPYDVDNHPPDWTAEDSIGQAIPISESNFEELARRWKNRRFVAMNHTSVHNGHDGNAYDTSWDSQRASIETVTSEHHWQNRVIASNSILKYTPPTADEIKRFGLYSYPSVIGYRAPCLLGSLGAQTAKTEEALQFYNATLGASRKVRIWMLVFTGQTREAALKQERLWQRGNKNELVICIGLPNGNAPSMMPDWVAVFSWTDREELLVRLRSEAVTRRTGHKPFDWPAYTEWMCGQVARDWKKRDFHEFDYLSVPMPTGALCGLFLLVLLETSAIGYYIATNENSA